MKRLAVLMAGLLFAASLFAVPSAGGAGEPSARTAALPEGVLGIVEFQNVTQLAVHMQSYAETVKPGTAQLPLVGPLFLWLGHSTNVAALDAARPLRLFLVKGEPGKVIAVRAFTVTDLAAYRKSLLPAIKKVEPADPKAPQTPGIERYTHEQRTFNREAFQKATPEERQDINNYTTLVSEPLFFGTRGNTVCIGTQERATRQVMQLLATGKMASTPLPAGHDIAACLDVEGLLAQLTTPNATPFQPLREKVAAGLRAANQPASTLAILEAELDALDAISAQVKRLDASLDATAFDLKTTLSLTALPETTLARYLAGVPNGLPEGLKYIPQDCWLVAAMRMGEMKPLLDWSAQFQQRIAAAMGQTPEQAALAASNMRALAGCYGDQFAFGLRSGPGLRIIEAMRLKDLQTPAKVQEQMTQMGPSFLGGMTELKVEIAEPIQYNGRTLGEWRFVPTPPEPNAAPDQIKEAQRKMFASLFGETLTVNHTLLGSDWLISTGPDALKSLKNILDEEAAPVTQLQSFKGIVQRLPAQTQGIVLLHLTEVVNWMQPFIQGMGGPLRMLQTPGPIARGPGMLIAVTGSPDGVALALTLPAAELRALVEGFTPNAAAERPNDCMQNLSLIGKALLAYDVGHEGAMPESLDQLVPEYIGAAAALRCPDARDAQEEYEYAGALPAGLNVENPIVACDRAGNHPAGRNVLFYDGRVTFMGEKQFQEMRTKNLAELEKASKAKGIALPESARKFYGE